MLIMHLVPARTLFLCATSRLSTLFQGRNCVLPLLALLPFLPARGLDKAVFFMGWRAEPETGGVFQAPRLKKSKQGWVPA